MAALFARNSPPEKNHFCIHDFFPRTTCQKHRNVSIYTIFLFIKLCVRVSPLKYGTTPHRSAQFPTAFCSDALGITLKSTSSCAAVAATTTLLINLESECGISFWCHLFYKDIIILTCITLIGSPVSFASCSLMCLVGLGVCEKAVFKISNCLAFIVVLGPLLFEPAPLSSGLLFSVWESLVSGSPSREFWSSESSWPVFESLFLKTQSIIVQKAEIHDVTSERLHRSLREI